LPFQVSRGAHADDGLARFDVVHDVLHLLVRQIAEAREDHHQIGGFERFQAGNVVILIRIDGSILPVDREKHGASEAMLLGENLAQLRQ
jgi:hypothetical protein